MSSMIFAVPQRSALGDVVKDKCIRLFRSNGRLAHKLVRKDSAQEGSPEYSLAIVVFPTNG